MFAVIIVLISTVSGLIDYALVNLFHFHINVNNKFDSYPFPVKLIGVSLAAPIIETYLFQQLPYTFLKRWNINNKVIILISSVLFGLSHSYSVAYMIFAFFAGIALMISFISWQGNINSKYLITAEIHCFANTSLLILDFFFS